MPLIPAQNGDFSQLIEAARALPGFSEDGPEKLLTIGFGRDTVMSVADDEFLV